MKTVLAIGAALLGVAQAATVQGFDVSNLQPNVNFAGAFKAGARFVIIKATESDNFVDAFHTSHTAAALKAGLIHGSYHFAHPDVSSGTEQAQFFLAHGGGWTADGKTLPGMIDLEKNPADPEGPKGCYGRTVAETVSFINEFLNEYHAKTKRYPLIYTNEDFWTTCTGNSKAFDKKSPLVLASFNPKVGTVPGGWGKQTIWQNSDHYEFGGDSDIYSGDLAQLKAFAKG